MAGSPRSVSVSFSRSERDQFLADVLRGLGGSPKSIPSKYLYDREGSRLFERICTLDEYYLTRAEMEILSDRLGDIAAAIGPNRLVIEPGAGSALKTRTLLRGLEEPAGYVPVDIADDQLTSSAERIASEFPDLPVYSVVADFTAGFELPRLAASATRRLVFFPGSTIGNFEPDEAVALLGRFAHLAGERGGLLVGIDLKKDAATLEAAYNDSLGVTAEFNLNLLARLNRELGADFELVRFRHHAFYESGAGRVEMHLVSLADHTVHVAEHEVRFRAGESIHTESSYKYTIPQFAALAREGAWVVKNAWTDAERLFAVLWARVV